MLAKERAKLGLDQPVWKQFVTWLWGAVRLDFGKSMWTGAPICEEIKLRFALSLQVAIMATFVAVILAIPLGVIAAIKQDTWVDYAVRIFSIAGLATPSFWLGIVFILSMLIIFKWLPPMVYTPFWVEPVAEPPAAHLAGPGRGIPVLRGGHAHDALGDAGGAARGLHPHRPRQGAWRS